MFKITLLPEALNFPNGDWSDDTSLTGIVEHFNVKMS